MWFLLPFILGKILFLPNIIIALCGSILWMRRLKQEGNRCKFLDRSKLKTIFYSHLYICMGQVRAPKLEHWNNFLPKSWNYLGKVSFNSKNKHFTNLNKKNTHTRIHSNFGKCLLVFLNLKIRTHTYSSPAS